MINAYIKNKHIKEIILHHKELEKRTKPKLVGRRK